MTTKEIVFVVLSVCLIGVAILSAGMYFNVNNTAMRLNNQCISQIADIENVHAETKKNLNQIPQIVKIDNEMYETYVKAYVEGREAIGKGTSWVWLQDNVLQKETKILSKLQDVILIANRKLTEANRMSNFTITSYNNYIMDMWNTPFLKDVYEQREIIQITTSASKEALETGVDDNMDLGL